MSKIGIDPMENISLNVKKPFFTRNKLVGAYIPKGLADLLSLYAVYNKKSKSQIIQQIFEIESKKFPTERQMLETVCRHALENWQNTVENNHGKTMWRVDRLDIRWREYRKKLEKGLKKMLPLYYVKQIIRYIEEAQF